MSAEPITEKYFFEDIIVKRMLLKGYTHNNRIHNFQQKNLLKKAVTKDFMQMSAHFSRVKHISIVYRSLLFCLKKMLII